LAPKNWKQNELKDGSIAQLFRRSSQINSPRYDQFN